MQLLIYAQTLFKNSQDTEGHRWEENLSLYVFLQLVNYVQNECFTQSKRNLMI